MLSEKQISAINLMRYEPVKIAHLLGYDKLGELHNKWMCDFINSKEDMTLQAHRGSYKTTCLSVVIPIIMILRPNIDIKFFRKTDDDVKEMVAQIEKALKSECLQYLSKIIYGREFEVFGNANELSISLRTTIKGSPQLVAMGIKGGITGKHGDLIITDDIITNKDRISNAERQYTKSIYMELQNIKNRGGRFINTGTPWHKDDAFILMPNIQKYNCYATGLINQDDIDTLRKSMSNSLFAANYELKHIADEDALFKTEPKFFDDASLIYDGIGHIDCAYGGEDGSALTLGKKIGDKFYLYGKIRKKHIDDCLIDYISLTNEMRCGTIYLEKNADKGYVCDKINSMGHFAQTYNEKTNKHNKISTQLKFNWDNVYFYRETDDDYISEILDYNELAQHDDCPDSAASLIRKLDNNFFVVM